ncbi:uncharacterized protein LOC109839523 isoform X6 [Asparagus officinalis]|uniref:uncharacterized protein LOC109839523 isoform X6 n=1 Tax=Asparagus officinalis TaxID=4686 RepID=UPI00098E0CD6|nr:uncharacterized protein LOC109839523 isoform X6 [Asparagus officinalis]
MTTDVFIYPLETSSIASIRARNPPQIFGVELIKPMGYFRFQVIQTIREELRESGVEVIQAAMDDLIRSSLLPDLKNSLEDTIERQIVRGIATIASQHSKFEVSLSQKFQQDLYFRIPNPEEASSSGAKDQEHSSVGKQDSSVHITTTEGASSSGAKD